MAHRKDTNHKLLAFILLLIVSHTNLGHALSPQNSFPNEYDYGMASNLPTLPSPPQNHNKWLKFPTKETQTPDVGVNEKLNQRVSDDYDTNGDEKTPVRFNCIFNFTGSINIISN